ncbi:MAG: hypothetical protein AB1330_09110 [Bacillota bacterium]
MLILLVGLVLALLVVFCVGFLWFLLRFKRQQDFASQVKGVTVEELDLESRLINIENKIETLTAICLELKERLRLVEKQAETILSRQVRSNGQLTAYEAVYKAFDQGKRVTELAQEFGRGKGEIELILNLRRLSPRPTGSLNSNKGG